MPLISVIVPCYNHGRFLPEAVKSILKQSLQDFEIVIVDDASTDDTTGYCSEVMVYDKRVRALHLGKNVGTSIANNVGIEASEGSYITVMHADDMRAPLSLEKLHHACVRHPHHFAYDDIKLMVNGVLQQGKTWKFPEYNFNALLQSNTIHAGIMFERQAFYDTGGYPPEFATGREDWAFNIMLGIKGYCGVHVSYPGYIYRRDGQNRTLTNVDPVSQNKFLGMIHARFSDLYAGRFPMGCCGQREPVNLNKTNGGGSVSMTLVGAEGMTAVEYLGGNFGTTTFYGSVTGVGYKFDANVNRIKMVDNRDLSTAKQNGLLDLREHTKQLFKIAQDQPVTPPPIVIEEKIAETKIVEPEVIEGKPLEDIVSPNSAAFRKLRAAGYIVLEQLKDISVEELVAKVGLTEKQAQALLEKR